MTRELCGQGTDELWMEAPAAVRALVGGDVAHDADDDDGSTDRVGLMSVAFIALRTVWAATRLESR